MAQLVYDCPRCHANRTTFDVKAAVGAVHRLDWQHTYEAFCVCRNCRKASIVGIELQTPEHEDQFSTAREVIEYGYGLEGIFDVIGFLSLKDHLSHDPPEHIPPDIADAFAEGESCFGIRCYNASSTMFRLCLDMATKPLLPALVEGQQPNGKTRRDLGLRVAWLFANGVLPPGLADLAKCIREDANDGAHVGNLTKHDAADIMEFTGLLLERLYTEPERLRLAQARRDARRQPPETKLLGSG